MKHIIFLLFIILNLVSCKNEKQETRKIDEDFKVFLEKFSRDSLFQISRVKFPLRVKELDNDYKSYEKKIKKNEYRKIDLRFHDSIAKRELNKYNQEIKLKENKATIEMRGIDNGIMIDIYFEKLDEKWILVGWNDSST